MRRIVLLLLLLSSFGLTTAVAASFDVHAEDVSSFSTPVSISVPEPECLQGLYLVAEHDILGDPDENLTTRGLEGGATWEWETGDLACGVPVVDKLVGLYISAAGNPGAISARIYECPGVTGGPLAGPIGDCTLLGVATDPTADNGENELSFVHVEDPLIHPDAVRAGYRLRLTVTNDGDKSFNLQWGKVAPDKDSELVVEDYPPA